MKKIILILFLFLLCYACYYIYNITEDKKLDVVAIGDDIANNPYLVNDTNIGWFNDDFTNKDYDLNDLLDIIRYNQEKEINNKEESIHQLLKKADILIVSIGMNDLYYKLNANTKEIYTYLNNLLNNYELILNEISRYDYKTVYVLGYYNISNENNDLFTYINYKLRKMANNYNYQFIDLNKILYNNPEYYQKSNDFSLNNSGYYQIFNLIVENLKKS